LKAIPSRSAKSAARIEPPAASQNAFHQLGRIWNLHLHLFHGRKSAVLQLLNVLARVYAKHIVVACRLWRDEIGRFSHSGIKQAFVDEPVLLRGKNVRANRQIVVIAVDELEWQHDRTE
jgi:hypothetical protein